MGNIINNIPQDGIWNPAEDMVSPDAEIIKKSEEFPWGDPYTPCGSDMPYQPETWLVLAKLDQYHVVQCRRHWYGGWNSGCAVRKDVEIFSSAEEAEAEKMFWKIYRLMQDVGAP